MKMAKLSAVAGSSVLINIMYGGTLSDESWKNLVRTNVIRSDEVYIVGHDKQTYAEVKEDLFRRLGADRER